MNSSNLPKKEYPNSPSCPDQEAVENELQLICSSDFFKGSKRSQEFLAFVIKYWLEGHEDPLKERTIGVNLYDRPIDYGTAEDPVVRVRAGEVRRRLERYNQAPSPDSRVHILLPVGSYVPECRLREPQPAQEDNACTSDETAAAEQSSPHLLDSDSEAQPSFAVRPVETAAPTRMRGRRALLSGAVCLVLAAMAFTWFVHAKSQDRVLRQFWAPAFRSPKPTLICIPKPVLFRPSNELYLHTAISPGEFDNEVDRMNSAPHLKPEDTLHWRDLSNNPDFGVGKGDVLASFRIANLLAKEGKSSELKIGSDYGWDDLRQSPAVLVGAFDNRAAMQITADLHFSFVQGDVGRFRIQEKGPAGRFWHPEFGTGASRSSIDYGLVTRLVNSSTGQFIISVAGILSSGSGAAAEIVTNEALLRQAVAKTSSDWKNKNLQIVVKTTVVDNVAGRPEIVAVYAW